MRNSNKSAFILITFCLVSALIYVPASAKASSFKGDSLFSGMMQSFKDRMQDFKQHFKDLRIQLKEKLQERIEERFNQSDDEDSQNQENTEATTTEETGEEQTTSTESTSTEQTKGECKIKRHLWMGMWGDDIKELQELLASDPDIYPEGLITGYFGYLTQKAVRRFQQYACLDQVGIVGPKTLAKIREILEEGNGNSWKIPRGLLIAPGIRKKLGCWPGHIFPFCKKWGCPTTTPATTTPTTTPDTIAPVISGLSATNTTATTTKIIWTTDEEADGKLWYSTSSPIIASSTPKATSSDLVLSHEFEVSGLSASTTYYYLISSSDETANTAVSTEKLFTTLPEEL
jgi:peptidoglycan hydrolase-like protein with peptidoglycan-binding domain